jgi:flagellin FlaB
MIELTVRKAPGAGNIDIGTTTLQMVHSSGSYDLVYDGNTDDTDGADEDGDADRDDFNVSTVQDDDSSITDSQVLNDPSDRAVIYINADAVISDNNPTTSSGNGLSEGSTATVRINTQSGGTTELRIVVPETLSGDSAVSL